MELHHSSQQEAYQKVTKLFINTPLDRDQARKFESGRGGEGEPNKAAKRNMIAWGFATLVPDENVRRCHHRASALWRNETRLLSLTSVLHVKSGTSQSG
jgi:hypothetical protein